MSSDYILSVTLFHLLIVAPVLFYVGINGVDSGDNAFFALLALSVLLFGHHLMKLIMQIHSGKSYSLYLFHLIAIAPVLFYVSYYKDKVKLPYFFTFLIGYGFLVSYIHGKLLFSYVHSKLS